MIRSGVFLGVLVLALLLAWWPWRGSLVGTLPRVAMASRTLGIAALLLLLLDPGVRAAVRRSQPLVLLDNSVSMHARAGQADSAAALAASLGEVIPFGEIAPGEPGGHSALGDPLAAIITAGRPIVVVSDGELSDAATIPPDLLAQASIRLLPRRSGPDVALADVRMPARLAAGDTLITEIELRATGGWRDSVRVEVRDGGRVLLSGSTGFEGERALLRLAGALPDNLGGERWLEVAIVGPGDAVPDDDVRLRRLIITPSPGIVVVAERPDWDARFLYQTLVTVTATPVRGFVQLRRGQWHRMDDLRPVDPGTVVDAARAADLLAVRGDTTAWSALGRARLLWAPAATTGDWYLSPAGLSPLAGAFAGLETDSLPPLPAATAVAPGDWVALEARQARRGAARPVVAGREAGGRTVVVGVDGLHRWAFRGGDAEQAWRTMTAEAVGWLLGSPRPDEGRAVPIEPVAQRGRPLRFRHAGEGPAVPLPVVFVATDREVADTLRFDPDGLASVVLPPGRYRYRLDGGPMAPHGVAVEAYADELVPGSVNLQPVDAMAVPAPVRRSVRDLLPLFGLAVFGFAVEWIIRRRLGMR